MKGVALWITLFLIVAGVAYAVILKAYRVAHMDPWKNPFYIPHNGWGLLGWALLAVEIVITFIAGKKILSL